jgi:hypothetical protein
MICTISRNIGDKKHFFGKLSDCGGLSCTNIESRVWHVTARAGLLQYNLDEPPKILKAGGGDCRNTVFRKSSVADPDPFIIKQK